MNRNKKLLDEFVKYCEANPQERFWQALKNFTEAGYIYFQGDEDFNNKLQDTFYFENKND